MSPMSLSDYPRPPHDNGRGIHWSTNAYPLDDDDLAFWIDELKAMQIKWVKLLDDSGGSSLPLCRTLIENDIMPIVRLYRERPNPGTIGGRAVEAIPRLIDVGVRYFETNNEPDLPAEWQNGFVPDDWIDIVVDNFIYDADIIQGFGGLPAYPAMSPWHPPGLGLEKVVERGRKDIFEKGAWLAIHNYTTNHPLDYPYDPVNQEGKPLTKEEYDRLAAWQYSHLSWEEIEALGIEISRENYERFNRWAWDGRSMKAVNAVRRKHKNPRSTIFDDPNCFRGWELAGHKIFEALGFYIPVITTEGGPVVGWGDDDRYAKVNPTTHAQWQMGIVRFMQDEAPSWYFTVCSWFLGSVPFGDLNPTGDQMSWYTHAWDLQFGLNGQLPVVQLMKDTPARIRHEMRLDSQMAAVTGVVTDTAGNPAAGVHLLLRTKDGENVAAALSDEYGRYELSASPGTYDIFIEWYGFAVRDVTLTAFDIDTINIENVGPVGHYEIWGYVEEEGGLNLGGLEVHLHRDGILFAQTISDESGKFIFRPTLAGEYLVESFDVAVAVDVMPSAPVVREDIILPAVSQLHYTLTETRLLSQDEADSRDIFYGTVRDRYGRGINGIELEMRWIGAALDTKFPRVTTGPGVAKWDGYYEFWHSKGTFLIEVVQGDFESDIAQLDTANVLGEHITFEVNFQLLPVEPPAAESVIQGSIPGGRLGQTVMLWKHGEVFAETSLNNARTFRFEQLPSGVYDLELAGIGVFETDVSLDGKNKVDVQFPLMGAIEGSVEGGGENQNTIKLISETYGFIRHGELSSDGQYRFTHLPKGDYRIEFGDDILSPLQCDGESTVTASLLRVGVNSATRKSEIVGRVHDTANRPARGVKVTLMLSNETLATTHTDSDGGFRFTKLLPGMYDVIINRYVGVSGLILDGENKVEVDMLYTPIAGAPVKKINRYYLLQMANEALLPTLTRLAIPWLQAQPSGSVGFNISEAQTANVVVLLGDGIPDHVVGLLQNAGCEIVDLRGDLLSMATKLAVVDADHKGESHE